MLVVTSHQRRPAIEKAKKQAFRTVSAGAAVAPVDPLLAVGARVTARAAAAVPAATAVLDAGSSVETGLIHAQHGAGLAVLPVETLRTLAGIIAL